MSAGDRNSNLLTGNDYRDRDRQRERTWFAGAGGAEAEPLQAVAEALVYGLVHGGRFSKWSLIHPGWGYFVGDSRHPAGWWCADKHLAITLDDYIGLIDSRFGQHQVRSAIKAAVTVGRARPSKARSWARKALTPYLPKPGAPRLNRRSSARTFRRGLKAGGISISR